MNSFAGAFFLAALASSCALMRGDLPDAPPPLLDLEEPLELVREPDDEAARQALDRGAFTGVYVSDVRQSLEEMSEAPIGVRVEKVIENSPAELAGILPGDVFLEARVGTERYELHWPSDWRGIELRVSAGTKLIVSLEREASTLEVEFAPVARLRSSPRLSAERMREEEKVGIVVRTATEVEARAAGLAPGGGAVVVGLARSCRWRDAGLAYGDLVTRVGTEEVSHPRVLLHAIQHANAGDNLEITIRRAGADTRLTVPVGARETEMKSFSIPLVYSWERHGDASEWSVLLGIVTRESTRAAWRMTILWLIHLEGGAADRLEEEPS